MAKQQTLRAKTSEKDLRQRAIEQIEDASHHGQFGTYITCGFPDYEYTMQFLRSLEYEVTERKEEFVNVLEVSWRDAPDLKHPDGIECYLSLPSKKSEHMNAAEAHQKTVDCKPEREKRVIEFVVMPEIQKAIRDGQFSTVIKVEHRDGDMVKAFLTERGYEVQVEGGEQHIALLYHVSWKNPPATEPKN